MLLLFYERNVHHVSGYRWNKMAVVRTISRLRILLLKPASRQLLIQILLDLIQVVTRAELTQDLAQFSDDYEPRARAQEFVPVYILRLVARNGCTTDVKLILARSESSPSAWVLPVGVGHYLYPSPDKLAQRRNLVCRSTIELLPVSCNCSM